MRKRKIAAALLCVFSFSLLPLSAEPTIEIEPYTEDQFPLWAQDLRRYEIISLGSLPFVLLITSLGYDTYRYFNSGMNPAYSPSPFTKKTGEAALSEDEQRTLFFTSLGVGALIGAIDFIIMQVQRNEQKKQETLYLENNNTDTIEIIEEPKNKESE